MLFSFIWFILTQHLHVLNKMLMKIKFACFLYKKG